MEVCVFLNASEKSVQEAKMKNIYIDVKKSIKDLQRIFENTDGGDERLREFNQEALEELKNLESESLEELESLKNNEEWEKFTIAFYGETGAGKSTLIECLRLFFKEPSKMDQQERFKRLYANMKNYRGSEHVELEKLQEAIATTIERQINPTIKEIKDKQPETYSNLDRSKDKFVSNLNNLVSKEIERFKSDFREKMYAHIEKDIENEECKEIFENERKQRTKKLRENIERHFNECKERFCEDIEKEIEQFEERIENSLAMLNHINLDSGFDSNFNIHSGIDGLGLFASIGGLVALLMMPVLGEIALVGGIVLGLVGIVKSLWNFFDSDYKKSQQKKEVDKNLDKVCEKIKEEMRNQIEGAKKGICEKVESLKARLNDPVVCYERMREGLIKAGEGLWQISNHIKTRIAQ